MAERDSEGDRNRRERRGFIGVLQAPFKQLKEKIRELQDKLARIGRLSDEENNTLTECQEEVENRKEAFFATDYGKSTKDLEDRVRRVLTKAIEELQEADPIDAPAKRRDLKRRLLEERIRARRHWEDQPSDIGLKLEDIAQEELEEIINTQSQRADEVILATGGEDNELIRVEDENNEELIRQEYRLIGVPEDEIDRIIAQTKTLSYRRELHHDSNIVKNLSRLGEEGREAREEVFNEIFAVVDSFPNEFFREAMDLNTMSLLAEFRRRLQSLPGIEGQKIRNEYMAKTKNKQMLHDAVCAIEQGAAKPESFENMMERYTPELFDELFKEPEAELAAHLYEVGTRTFRAQGDRDKDQYHNWVEPERMFYDAKRKESDIDRWVRSRFVEIIKVKYGLSDRQFKEQWSEQRIGRVMALGKGYEMITLRMPEMVARGRIPEDYKKANIVVSPAYEDFVRPLDAFEHLIEKFEGYDDPGARFLLYILTRQRLEGSSRAEIARLFKKEHKVDPKSLRMIDIVNWIGGGGPWSRSNWRREMLSWGVPHEKKKWLGLAFRIADADQEFKDKAENIRARKEIFLEEIKRNPMAILREAELQDGEIFDLKVQEKVLEEFSNELGVSKEEAGDFKQRAEHWLITLGQIEVDKDKGRKGEIDFNHIDNREERSRAQAYYEAIRKVVNEETFRTWTDKEGRSRNTSLVDYLAEKEFPYAAGGLEDTPWSDDEIVKFNKMGQKGFARRIRDYVAAYKVMAGINNLQENFAKLRKGEDVVASVDEIWKAFRIFTKSGAITNVGTIYEGIASFNAANWTERYLPAPFGAVARWAGNCGGLLKGVKPTSYAQEIYGPSANSWRAVDIRNLLFNAQLAGHIDAETREKLQGRLRATTWHMWKEGLMRGWLVGGIFVAGVLLKELWAQIQEDMKQ